jgi:hypothetical protein
MLYFEREQPAYTNCKEYVPIDLEKREYISNL